jgi:protein involved in polysaccharide export with SLBB domain
MFRVIPVAGPIWLKKEFRVSQPAALSKPVSAAIRGGGTRTLRAIAGRAVGVLAVAGALVLAGGCEIDSFMDPSVVGRWENTPTIVPVLERIDIVERDTGEFVDVTPVMPEDLLPEVSEYRVGSGDGIILIILDFIQSGQESRYEMIVDPRGFISVPQLGEIFVNKRTRTEIQQLIVQAVRDKGILDDPLVDVQVPGARQATFSIFGVVDRAGRYTVPSPDYRLLEAITDAGGLPPSVEKLYIIRQVTLTDASERVNVVEPRATTPAPRPAPTTRPPTEGVDLENLIDELMAPDPNAPRMPEAAPEQRPLGTPPAQDQPATTPEDPQGLEDIPQAEPPAPSLSITTARATGGKANRSPIKRPVQQPASTSMSSMADGTEPPIDLPDTRTPAPLQPIAPLPAGGPQRSGDDASPVRPARGKWMFLNGEWVQVIAPESTAGGLPEGQDPIKESKAEDVITQRVIEVPVGPLVQGVAQYNLVIRAGDVISVPGPRQGFVYIGGPGASRPGVYQLPFTGKLTLQRLVMASGGLSAIAIPERVDITRMVGEDRQATVRLNLRAISEGTNPDLFLKPDDMVNIGTNFWATPLAVIRGGMRASYGFGFLLDRNFGNDVFGAPPENRNF